MSETNAPPIAAEELNVDLPTNPFSILTFISAPAVLTNASCVLLFGTGNRYGRAIDRVHELADLIVGKSGLGEPELNLRVRQLDAAESRTLLIVRALTCFYSAVAGFVASTLISLIGAILVGAGWERGVQLAFALALLAGTCGVLAMIVGSFMLARESRFSFQVLREERGFLAERVERQLASLVGSPQTAK